MTLLSPNFTLDEFTNSQTAARLGIRNDPPADVYPTLKKTANGLELVRMLLGGKPILISSGYRSPALNSAVHGQSSSQHLAGEAVDFTCPQYGTPEQIVAAIAKSTIPFDQVILEFSRWVHISFSSRNRRQALVIDDLGTRAYK